MKIFPSNYLPIVNAMFEQGRGYAGLTALYLARSNREKITERAMWNRWQKYAPQIVGQVDEQSYNDIVREIMSGGHPLALHAARAFYSAHKIEGRILLFQTDTASFVQTPKLSQSIGGWNFTACAFYLLGDERTFIKYEDLHKALYKYLPLDEIKVDEVIFLAEQQGKES